MAEYSYNSRIKRRKVRKRHFIIKRLIQLIAICLLLTGIIMGAVKICTNIRSSRRLDKAESIKMPNWVDVQLLDKSGKARSGTKLTAVNNIVIHYVGNPGSSAQNNRDYFNKKDTEVCSHFLVGLKGEIIQCVPIDEKSAATNWRNKDTISIEVCHDDETGEFNNDTYNSVIKLTSWLCNQLGLTEDDVIRHYDVTGKKCPLYYVDHEDKWEELKNDVKKQLQEFKKQSASNS